MGKIMKSYRLESETCTNLELLIKNMQARSDRRQAADNLPKKKITETDVIASLINEKIESVKYQSDAEKIADLKRLTKYL